MTDELSRRQFFNRMSLGLSGLIGGVLAVPVVSYLLSPLLRPERQQWTDLGPADQFPNGQTVLHRVSDPSPLDWSGQTAETAVWVRRQSAQDFVVFAVNCTHLGCPVDWRPGANLFLCPCHGGVYYADGSVAGGPPPRALRRYTSRVQNGTLQVLAPLLGADAPPAG